MAYYLMLSNLTDDGARTVKNKPERIKEVNAEVEAMGVKILSQYALVGLYDFVSILEAPDNEAVIQVSVELSSRGTMKMITLPAIPIDDFISRLKK